MSGPPGSFCIGEGSGIFAEIALAENRRSPLPLPFSEQYLWKALPAALSSYRRIQALSGKSRHPRTYRTSQAVGTKQAGQAERTNLSIPGCAPANLRKPRKAGIAEKSAVPGFAEQIRQTEHVTQNRQDNPDKVNGAEPGHAGTRRAENAILLLFSALCCMRRKF